MEIKSKIFPEDSKEFPWDKQALETFKRTIIEKGMKSRMDDIFLLGFLRARKFDQARSIELFQNYHNRRCENPNLFQDLLPSKLESTLSLNMMQFLQKPDQRGRYVFIIQIANFDLDVTNITDYIRTILLFMDFQLNFHRTQENRVALILNSEGLTLRHLLACRPGSMYSLATSLFGNSQQIRFEEIHYVNVNIILKAILSIFIPLLPFKIKERVHLHSDMSTLHEFIHPEFLPAELDGELPSLDPTEMNKMLLENEEYFRMNQSYLRAWEEQKSKNYTEGRFRYLDEDEMDKHFKSVIQTAEENFKRLEEDPEKYLSRIDSEFEITRL